MTVKKVLACASPIVKMDGKGNLYRWHNGVGLGDVDPSRYYIETGEEYYETKYGLKRVNEVKEMVGECDEDETQEADWKEV